MTCGLCTYERRCTEHYLETLEPERRDFERRVMKALGVEWSPPRLDKAAQR